MFIPVSPSGTGKMFMLLMCTLLLSSAFAADNVDANLQVYVIYIDPMNVYTVLPVGESYVPKYKGKYTVKYDCEDKNYNTTYTNDYVIYVD